MAIALGNVAAISSSATRTITPAYPTVSAGDYIVLVIGQKYANRTVPTPSGFTALGTTTGGAGTDGTVDEGNVSIWAYGKIADGTESGTLSITDSGGTASCFAGRMASFTKAGGETWDVVGNALASDNTAGTSLVWTYDTDPGLAANDWALTFWCSNSDAYSHTHALTCSGLSGITSTSRINSSVTAGANLRLGMVTHEIGSGTSSGVATYTNTASGSATNAPAGASVLVRLRVTSSGGASKLPLFMHNYRQRRSA